VSLVSSRLRRSKLNKPGGYMVRTKRKPMRRMSLADMQPPPRAKRPESLTTREQEILELIWAGFKNKEIGQRLKISVKTVEAHRSNMMKKMRVSNTAQLLRTAIDGSMIRIRVA
jgi:DNA-binding NarL/FixJ family response regulator